jgi:hypothetical protein
MTTENTNTARDLNTLLNLDTYQGMTDEEIELILNYKIESKVRERIIEASKTINTLKMEALLQQNVESSQRAMSMLQSIRDRKPVLHTVGGGNE